MSTTTNLKHLIKTNVFGITDKIKAFQKPRRDNSFSFLILHIELLSPI